MERKDLGKRDEDFNQIKRELVDAVKEIQKTLAVYNATAELKEETYRTLIHRFTESIDLHRKVLYGDGTKNDQGIVGDVKDLKAAQLKTQTYIGWAWIGAITAFFTVAADLIVNIFKNRSH